MKTNVLPLLSVVALVLCTACPKQPSAPSPSPTPTPAPGTGTNPPTSPAVSHEPVLNKELMITDLSVVNDGRATGPDGPWSFGGLIKRMAGTTNPSRFVVNWLKTWETNQTVNTFTVPARSRIRSLVIDPWKAKDGQAAVTDDAWNVNLANAPFRLLAIVNRIDLHDADATTVRNAGEGRFVFGVLNGTGDNEPFTVIFEYEQIATDRERLRGWAQEWHALGTMSFGPAYNAALEVITEKFAGQNRAPAKPNGSPLNQLRTNEISLVLPASASLGWELREFHIVGGFLRPVPTRQAPSNSFQGSPALVKFINDHEADILDNTFEVPVAFDGAPFLAGSSLVAPPTVGFFWQAPGVSNPQARFTVALNTCNGCHHVETGTTDFLHVKPRAPGAEAGLSGFLTGITDVPDPVTPAVKRNFNDLAARAEILKAVATEVGTVRLNSMTQSRRSRVH